MTCLLSFFLSEFFFPALFLVSSAARLSLTRLVSVRSDVNSAEGMETTEESYLMCVDGQRNNSYDDFYLFFFYYVKSVCVMCEVSEKSFSCFCFLSLRSANCQFQFG